MDKASKLAQMAAGYFGEEDDDEFIENFAKDIRIYLNDSFEKGRLAEKDLHGIGGYENESLRSDLSRHITIATEQANEIERLREAVKLGADTLNTIRGAIESDQIVDKDIHRLCITRRDELRGALSVIETPEREAK